MTYGMLDINFEGYFMCRIATDPDPTNEERGMSGYTMALVNEDPLDQVIRLQMDPEWLEQNARPPLLDMKIPLGVKVWSVTYNGTPYDGAKRLLGAKVYLDGTDFPLPGPTFESRNSTVGSDDSFAFVVNPFNLRIEHEKKGVKLTATDVLDPAHPDWALWQITDPNVYGRRLPNCATVGENEVSEAVNVWDAYGYFRDRRRYLDKLISDSQAARNEEKSKDERDRLDTLIETCRSRIYQLDHWGDRVIGKIQTKVSWEFDINGPQKVEGDLGGYVDTGQPWHVKFWFGGWDGDLLLGYTRGTLSVPFSFVPDVDCLLPTGKEPGE
jgi:hypothetical protein